MVIREKFGAWSTASTRHRRWFNHSDGMPEMWHGGFLQRDNQFNVRFLRTK
jgi:hypothetical protein